MANRKKITPPELSPEIVLFHILPKLPVKSLLRFRCVCKPWRRFLTSPVFANIHLHRVTTVDPHEKVLFFFQNRPHNFQTIDCEDGSLAKPRCYPFAAGASLILPSSMNGLICLGIPKHPHGFSDVMLWNPLTSEYKTLSRPIDTECYNAKAMKFHLYHTCSDDDYRILSITIDGNVYIYSLKSDSWKKLESTLDNIDRIPYASDDNLLDDKLRFLMALDYVVPKKIRGPGKRGYIIIRLDLKTEKLTKIAVPSSCENGTFLELKSMVVRGCIELTVFTWEPGFHRTLKIEVWRMNGDGDWTKMVHTSYSHDPNRILLPLYLMRNGNLIMHAIGTQGICTGICKVDPEENTEDVFCYGPQMVLVPQIYIVTFVSPNQYVVK